MYTGGFPYVISTLSVTTLHLCIKVLLNQNKNLSITQLIIKKMTLDARFKNDFLRKKFVPFS